jgi:3-hydroxybutyryl-CoA dehydrogenase
MMVLKSKYALTLLVNMVRAGKLGVKSGEGFYDYSRKKAESFLNNLYKV